MSIITMRNLNKVYSDKAVGVSNLSVEIPDNGFMVILGPGSSGKSTILKMIAGLESITSGEVYIDNKLLNISKPQERPVAIILKNYTLYPNMTVRENISYGLTFKKFKQVEIDIKVEDAAKCLKISNLLDKKPNEISLTEKYRVIFARAAALNPRLILIDDIFYNLDFESRETLKVELLKIYEDINTTFIYATSNPSEALSLGKRIAIINKGEIQQIGYKEDILSSPCSCFISRFIFGKNLNVVKVKLIRDGENYFISFFNISLKLPKSMPKELLCGYEGKTLLMCISYEDISCNVVKKDLENISQFRAKVRISEKTPEYYSFEVNFMKLIFKPQPEIELKNKEEADVCFNMEKVFLFDIKTEKNILIK